MPNRKKINEMEKILMSLFCLVTSIIYSVFRGFLPQGSEKILLLQTRLFIDPREKAFGKGLWKHCTKMRNMLTSLFSPMRSILSKNTFMF